MEADRTQVLGGVGKESLLAEETLLRIYSALQEKGYDPVRQLTYFLLSGEPTYITAHRNARSLAAKLERDEVIEELLRFYLSRRAPAEVR